MTTTATSLCLYTALVLAFAVERVVELVVSTRHTRALLRRGGVEIGRGEYPPMVALHASLLAGCLLEPWLFDRPFVPELGFPMLVLALGAQALRWWAISTLGTRWTTRVVVLPGAPRIACGPYRFFPHPNYLAVIVEGFALPLVPGAWITAALFTVANAVILSVRVRSEDAALDDAASRVGAAA